MAIDPSVKKVKVDGEEVERDPNFANTDKEKTAQRAALQNPARGLLFTRLRFPGANGHARSG